MKITSPYDIPDTEVDDATLDKLSVEKSVLIEAGFAPSQAESFIKAIIAVSDIARSSKTLMPAIQAGAVVVPHAHRSGSPARYTR